MHHKVKSLSTLYLCESCKHCTKIVKNGSSGNLFPLLVCFSIEDNGDGLQRRQISEFKLFSPKAHFTLLLTGSAGKQGVVQQELTEVSVTLQKENI